jgi:intracellular septation protein
MKFLFDLFPVILFFAAFKAFDIFVATGVAIAATFLQICWVWLRHRQVERMMWINLAVIIFFGGATLIFQDELFIKWKPTVLYWLFAGILWGALFFPGKNLIRLMLEKQIALPDSVWQKLNFSWIVFFIFMGCINLYIAFSFPIDTWVNFKLFGSTGLMLVFVISQLFMIRKYLDTMIPATVDSHTVEASVPRRGADDHTTNKD